MCEDCDLVADIGFLVPTEALAMALGVRSADLAKVRRDARSIVNCIGRGEPASNVSDNASTSLSGRRNGRDNRQCGPVRPASTRMGNRSDEGDVCSGRAGSHTASTPPTIPAVLDLRSVSPDGVRCARSEVAALPFLQMDLFEEIVDIPTHEGEMAVVIKQPVDSPADGGSWPTVMIMIDAPGIRKATHEFMAKLASTGYRVITPDLHHRQGRMVHVEPKQAAADPSLRAHVKAWIAAMTDEQIQRDVDQALVATGADHGPLGTIGFCLGARAAVRAMTRLPDRFVCGAGWHPSFLADDKADSPHLTPEQIVGDLYLGIGDADQVQSIAVHQRFLDATAEMSNVNVDIWPDADHGFTWPGYATYNKAASEGCWAKTIALFERNLT